MLVAVALLAATGSASADAGGDAAAAAALVREIHYEGLPYERARAITPAGAARLAELLNDPAERAHAANAVLALGIAAQPGAFEAIAGAAEHGSSGGVDRATYRLRTAIPIAMGHLARSDDRALAWLVARAETRGADPGWWSGPFAGQRLADQLRRRAIDGLALSGRPEAAALLQRIALEGGRRAAGGDPELAAQIETASAVHARIAAHGADAVLASPDAETAR
jgi:hypothetical protein